MRGTFYSFRETVYCFDAMTGQVVWKNEQPSVYTRFLQSGSPAVADGKLYILGAGLTARCIQVATGKTLWEQRLPGDFTDEFMDSSFAVSDGVAVVLAGHLFGAGLPDGPGASETALRDLGQPLPVHARLRFRGRGS